MHQSVHSNTRLLKHMSCETPFRYHLKKLTMDEFEQKSTAILAHSMRDVLGNLKNFALILQLLSPSQNALQCRT